MSRRIRIPDGVIIDKRVPIPGLRPLRPGRANGVGGGETSQRGVHPARVEEVDSETGFFALSGALTGSFAKFVVRAEIAVSTLTGCFAIPRLTEGFVPSASGMLRDIARRRS